MLEECLQTKPWQHQTTKSTLRNHSNILYWIFEYLSIIISSVLLISYLAFDRLTRLPPLKPKLSHVVTMILAPSSDASHPFIRLCIFLTSSLLTASAFQSRVKSPCGT